MDGQYLSGFGPRLGQAIQERYSETGWIFTVGEIGSVILLVTGVVAYVENTEAAAHDSTREVREKRDGAQRSGTTRITLGAIGLIGFRIWELVDVIYGPIKHNNRYDELKRKSATSNHKLQPIIGSRQVGLALSFTF